jgi:hypothetical protein
MRDFANERLELRGRTLYSAEGRPLIELARTEEAPGALNGWSTSVYHLSGAEMDAAAHQLAASFNACREAFAWLTSDGEDVDDEENVRRLDEAREILRRAIDGED